MRQLTRHQILMLLAAVESFETVCRRVEVPGVYANGEDREVILHAAKEKLKDALPKNKERLPPRRGGPLRLTYGEET